MAEDIRSTDQRLRDRTRQLAAVNALAARMTGMTDAVALVAAAAADLGEILDASSCAIVRVGAGGQLVAEAGTPSGDPSLAARALREDRPILITDASARARLAVPLVVDGTAWGAIEAVASAPGAFDEDDLRLAEAVAAHTAAALHAAHRYADLRRAYEEAVASGGPPVS
jgi:GAF domain-containing protein